MSSHSLSIISDFGEAPLSSTRVSSFLDLSAISDRPSWRGAPYNRLSDFSTNGRPSQDWNKDSDRVPEAPSILSSTRMSVVGAGATLPILQEDVLFTDCGALATKVDVDPGMTESRVSISQMDTALPACPLRGTSRKSVSFRDADECFPAFSPECPKQEEPGIQVSYSSSEDFTFDLSEYSDFLDAERMATVLHHQGIDATSPDHVYVFSRDSSESTESDMEKTVINHFPLEEESDNETDGENVNEVVIKAPERPACGSGGSGSSGTSHYSSCESDHYTSALEASSHPRPLSSSDEEEKDLKTTSVESDKETQIPRDSNAVCVSQEVNIPPVKTEHQRDSQMEKVEDLTALADNLTLSDETSQSSVALEACSSSEERAVDTTTEGSVDDDMSAKPTACTPIAGATTAASEEDSFTPSPFVTGRTRSRLSRCSMRTSKTPESFLSTSSLFEQTLPTPLRTRRQTPRSQGSDDVFYSSPDRRCLSPPFSGSITGSASGDCWLESQETQSSTLRAGPSVSASQADTVIISGSMADTLIQPQCLSDTVIVEKDEESLSDAYEKGLKEIMLAIRGKDVAEGGEFLTDDLTSADEAKTKESQGDVPEMDKAVSLKNEDAWITADFDSQAESVSSSSSSSYFSPRRSREDSDPPCTPGTGCTPRYSMSRLSGVRRPQHLANLSYTPGGRPHIQDLEEPVEYLYTDTEDGHKLIETHVPPTASTSFSSSMSASSSDETILYDWRSMQVSLVTKEKENQEPQRMVGEEEEKKLPETKGLTDKELRRMLVELGESPGPISSRTRPVYMQRLRRMLLESKSELPQQKQSDQSQGGNVFVSLIMRSRWLH